MDWACSNYGSGGDDIKKNESLNDIIGKGN
jgi:hypothetical protein